MNKIEVPTRPEYQNSDRDNLDFYLAESIRYAEALEDEFLTHILKCHLGSLRFDQYIRLEE